MNVFRWLKSVTGFSAISAVSGHLQHIGERPGWPILVENMDEWDIRVILDRASIESWSYFIQPGTVPGTITGATWVIVPNDSAHWAETVLRRHGAMIGGRQLTDGYEGG